MSDSLNDILAGTLSRRLTILGSTGSIGLNTMSEFASSEAATSAT